MRAFALVANALWVLLLLPVAIFLTDRGPMAREEWYLERKFEEPYRSYKVRVRRWI